MTGIPIDTVFSEPKDQAAMRRKHGLEPDRAAILVSAGGFGVGRIGTMLTDLDKLRHRAQVVAICGRNQELHAELQVRAASQSADARVRLKAVGFTTEMDELMVASDLIVGKPGDLTTSDALARGLVFLIVNPIPGQEERNSDHLLEEGAVLRCNNLPVLAYKIDRLFDDPARLAAMCANARRLGRPSSALDIVGRLVALRAEPVPPRPAASPAHRPAQAEPQAQAARRRDR